MIRLRVDFIEDAELEIFTSLIEDNYNIIEKSKIKDSKKEGSKFRLQFLELVNKKENKSNE